MTKLNKNLKIAIIVAIAVLAFTAINVCIWHGANAETSAGSEGQDITRHGVKVDDASYRSGCYYRFSEKDGNMGPWVLNSENATHKRERWDGEVIWWNDHIGNKPPALLYDNPDKIPSCSDDFVYHHNGEHYEMYNMHFCIPSKTYHKHDATCSTYYNRITLEYHTATPMGSKDNKFRFYFDVDLMPDGQNVEKTIHMWDQIVDKYDNTGHADSDYFHDAGYNKDNGDLIEDALAYVGADSLYQAVKDHKMVVRVVELRFWP